MIWEEVTMTQFEVCPYYMYLEGPKKSMKISGQPVSRLGFEHRASRI
jgi:hypothetical protein